MKRVRLGVFVTKKPIIWLQLAVILVGIFALSFPVPQAKAAPGDVGDTNGLWLTHDSIQYNGLTYNLLSGNNSFGNRDVFSTSAATCNDAGSHEDRPTSEDGYILVTRDAPSSSANDGSGQLLHVDNGNVGHNGTNCQTFGSGANGPKNVPLSTSATSSRHTWFYRSGPTGEDADHIFTSNGSVEFDRDRSYTPEAPYNATTEVYARAGENVCADILVKNNGQWLLFPVTPKDTVRAAWPESVSFDNTSEDYNAISGDHQNRCRLTSEEIIFDYHISQVAGVNGPDYVGGTNSHPPGTGGFDGHLIDVAGSNFCDEQGLGANGPPKWVSVDSSRGILDSGVTIHEVIMFCQHNNSDNNYNYVARRSWESSADYSFTGHATVTQKGVHYFDPADLRVLHSDHDDNGYTVIGGVSDLPPPVKPSPPPGGNTGGTAPPVDCNAGAFTWLICPIIHGLVDIVDWLRDNLLLPFLKEAPLTTTSVAADGTVSPSPIYQIWQTMRNVASIFFILVFFFIIIGTAAGFDNYTIKKVLPHLVAGAILVPLSWYICAIMIDISNVLGQGIVALVSSVIPTVHIDFTSSVSTIFFGFGGIMVVTLAYFAFAGISMALLLTMLFGILSAVLTLLLRKVLIVAFIIASPFALLAWVLPNTESWFKRWWKNYFKLVMMYPFIIMFVEAGRIFSATAGAALGASSNFLSAPLHLAAIGLPMLGAIDSAAVAQTVAPIAQCLGLYVPDLFIPKLVPKLMDESMSFGQKGINAARGALNKEYGKDSDRAKEAAENRVRNSIRRDREYEDKSAKASGLNKMRYKALSRFNARRAGIPRSFRSADGGNESRHLAREAAYSKAQAEHGIVGANNANSAEKLPKETEGERERAEIRMAQLKKINERGQRMGLVRDMDEAGAAGVVAGNAALYRSTLIGSARSAATERGNALGIDAQERSTPTTKRVLENTTKAAAVNSQSKAAEERGAVTGTVNSNRDLDQILAAEHLKNTGSSISLEEAHRLRMNNVAHAAALKTGKQMVDSDVDVNTTNTADADLNKEFRAARLASGGSAISIAQARQLRAQERMAGATTKGRKAAIMQEGEERTYNEVERQANALNGGKDETTGQLLQASRLLSRQGMADDRQKRVAAIDAGKVGGVATGADLVNTNALLSTSRYTAAKSFGAAQGAVQGTQQAMQAEAERDARATGGPVTAGTANAYRLAASRSFQAGKITSTDKGAEAFGKEAGEITSHAAVKVGAGDTALHAENAAIRSGGQHAGALLEDNRATEEARQAVLASKPFLSGAVDPHNAADRVMAAAAATAAGVESGRKTAAALGNDQGTTNEVDDAIKAEMAATGATASAARATVMNRRSTASRISGQTRSERDTATNVSTDAGTLRSVESRIQAEMTKSGTSRDVAEAAVRARELGAIGAGAEEKAAFASTDEAESALGGSKDFNSEVRQSVRAAGGNLANPADVAAAQDRVRQTRLTDSGNAARTKTERDLARQRGQKAGVTRDIESEARRETQKLLARAKKTGAVLSQADAEAQAADNIADRNLGALATQAVEESSASSRAETSKAIGVQNAVNAQIAQQARELRKAIPPITGAPGSAARAADTIRFNAAVAAANAAAIVQTEDKNLKYAGEEAQLSGQKEFIETVNKRIGTVETARAAEKKAPVEAARTEEYNRTYAAAREAAFRPAYNDALAAGKTPDEAKRAGDAAADVVEEASRKTAKKAADTAAAKTEADVTSGLIGDDEQRDTLIEAQGIAAKEGAERAEATAQANTIGMVEAAKASTRLNAGERITMQGENVKRSLASQSGAERAQYELTKPGTSMNRSYQAIEADTQRVQRNAVLKGLVAEAQRKNVTYTVETEMEQETTDGKPYNGIAYGEPGSNGQFKVDPTTGKVEPVMIAAWQRNADGTIKTDRTTGKKLAITRTKTDTIGKTDINTESIKVMSGRVHELLGDGSGPPEHEDEAIALLLTMAKTNQGTREVMRIQQEIFGGTDFENIDATRLGGRAREIWEQIQEGTDIHSRPVFTIPPAALFDGYSDKQFQSSGYAEKLKYFDYARHVKKTAYYEAAARNIYDTLTNQNTKGKINEDDYQAIWLFLQDEEARKTLNDIVPPPGTNKPSGFDIMGSITAEATGAGARGKFNQYEIDDYNTRVIDTENSTAGLRPGDPGFKPHVRVGDAKPLAHDSSGALVFDPDHPERGPLISPDVHDVDPPLDAFLADPVAAEALRRPRR